jgi:hypothetical protein
MGRLMWMIVDAPKPITLPEEHEGAHVVNENLGELRVEQPIYEPFIFEVEESEAEIESFLPPPPPACTVPWILATEVNPVDTTYDTGLSEHCEEQMNSINRKDQAKSEWRLLESCVRSPLSRP